MHSLTRLLGIIVCCALNSSAWAQTPSTPAAAGPNSPLLPLSRIVLYASGVGYFQRDGQVEGRQQVALRFKLDNINDLLKSLLVQDFDGGSISTVTYDSRDPITRTLKSFAIDLTDNAGLGHLLWQMRGERVEVALPNVLQGLILGVETKKEVKDEGEQEIEYVNLLTDTGLRAIPLPQIQQLRLLNEQLNEELRQALAVLAASHDMQKKTVTLDFTGTGQRRVRVGYITEMPVWKTSYRLALAESDPPLLQGWALVENTTDEDWQNVRLSLISGRPISFVMDMYAPLYAQRPVVVPESYAALRPQVYGQAMESADQPLQEAKMQEQRRAQGGKPAEASGAGEALLPRAMMAPRPPPPAAAEPAQQMFRDQITRDQGMTAAAEGTELGELFEYAIATPVSLARQKSAMLPIVNEAVEGPKVSIYNQRVHAKHPLHGVRLRNVTALHLLQGPVTVFDGGAYAGDARLDDLPPGQERLLSYAMDLKTEVESVAEAEQRQLMSVSIRKGSMLVTQKAVAERTYNIRNRDQKPRVLLIEHPFRADWQLASPSAATERTREVYRFTVTVAPGAGSRFQVREEKPLQQTITLTDAGPEVLAHYLRASQVSEPVKAALQRVNMLRDRLDQTVTQRRRLEQQMHDITQEQGRIRENMSKLAANAELYARYVRKLDQQETDLESMRRETEKLKTTEEQQRKELQEYLMGLELS
ncbi:MAG: hypothetical protein AB7N91_03145 [Candidatus Tectimicrobiota bacterium]